ncbi:hypothetical protein LVY65_01100 [Sphingomonas sp. G124]|uniref:DUF4145 domain-containing protein n=1 Tax=Sphingomonas cremea TaxID=2904799 RepID=A0A9X1QID0_9SPHN|nr:hypothetical protein [Sphingomonas cremea]MCF2513665.1 hypothetical protein [Sphingomonas cremea]
MTFEDLARMVPSAEILDQYFQHIDHESDRGAAVMVAALVERALENHLRSKLHDPGDGTQDKWFCGINAPFRTFSAKISLGRALEILDADVEAMLVRIKNIRNLFAHGMIPLDFTNPTIAAECSHLVPKPVVGLGIPMRMAFATSCITIARLLGMTELFRSNLGDTAGNGQGPLQKAPTPS